MKNFKRNGIRISCAIAGLLLAALPACAERPSINDLVSRIQEKYEQTSDLKARFVQESTLKTMKRTEREEGAVYFKRPKRMLWDYTKPSAKKLVINPRTAWLYVPEDKMVYVQDSNKIFNSKLTIKFLTGIGKLKDDFNIRYSQPDTDGKGDFLLDLTPKNPGPEAGFEKLHVTVGKDTFMITRCSFKDVYGNSTVISFADIKINNHLPDSLFTFKPPAGVEVQKVP